MASTRNSRCVREEHSRELPSKHRSADSHPLEKSLHTTVICNCAFACCVEFVHKPIYYHTPRAFSICGPVAVSARELFFCDFSASRHRFATKLARGRSLELRGPYRCAVRDQCGRGGEVARSQSRAYDRFCDVILREPSEKAA